MKTFTRLFALLLVLVMALSMTAMAADTFTDATTGSITIHKYELNGTAGDHATGLEAGTLPDGATPLAGVTFTAYQVVDATTLKAYYDGTADDTTEAKITAAMADPTKLYTESNGTYTVKNISGTTVTGTSKTTGSDGIAAFTGLNLGLYLIVESEAPDKVVTTQTPFLVSLPMTVNNEWLYDVHVYPKNSTSEGNVTLTKTDASGSPLAGVTFKLEKQEDTAWTVVGENQTTNASGIITWSALTHGEYRITEISAPEGYIVDSNPIAFTVKTDNTIECTDARALLTVGEFNTTSKTLPLTLVNEKPTIDKICFPDYSYDPLPEPNTGAVGDTVNFLITVDIPHNIADMKTFTITDTFSGLSWPNATYKPSILSSIALDTSDYTITRTDNGFTMTFHDGVLDNKGGQKLKIGYTLHINTDAANDTQATNDAQLTYSTDPNTTYTTKDTVITKLYSATVTKKLDSETGAAGSGVKFQAYDDSSLETPLKFTQYGNGLYFFDPDGNVTTLVTSSNGTLLIKGLGKKTYYLVETETKAGYNLLSDAVEMNVGAETDYEYETTIVNKKGFNLPQTGGIGTLMFIVIGGVLMAGGICLVSTGKKRAS